MTFLTLADQLKATIHHPRGPLLSSTAFAKSSASFVVCPVTISIKDSYKSVHDKLSRRMQAPFPSSMLHHFGAHFRVANGGDQSLANQPGVLTAVVCAVGKQGITRCAPARGLGG
jgi:hypothetical protein